MNKQLSLPIPNMYPEQTAALENFIRHACAFTGHRPRKFPWKYNETDPACLALKEVLASQVKTLVQDGCTDFLSGMAPGVDTWGAQIVLDLRENNPALKLHCIVPCAEQNGKWKWPEDSKALYRYVLDRADSVIYLRRGWQKGCELERDRFLAGYASKLLAVYNGERRGGTAATVRFARKFGRDIIIIDPASLEITRENAAELT